MNRWQNENGVKITKYEDMDIDSFKQAVDGVDEWYQKELKSQGYDDAKDLIETFTKKDTSSAGTYDVEERSDLDWPEQTWNFTCSTTETSTWQKAAVSSETDRKSNRRQDQSQRICRRPADQRKPVRGYPGTD